MKKLLSRILFVLALMGMIISCNGRKNQKSELDLMADSLLASMNIDPSRIDDQVQPQSIEEETAKHLPEEPIFDIVTNLGTIRVKLYSNTPKHKANFAKLAMSGFYDSLLFHRVVNGFMIQGGDPYTKDTTKIAEYGQGGPGYLIPAEIRAENTHKRGALAAARKGDIANPKRESNGSQFYIVQNQEVCAQLDGQYTVFGETILGFETIDKIASELTDYLDRPVDDIRILTVKLIED